MLLNYVTLSMVRVEFILKNYIKPTRSVIPNYETSKQDVFTFKAYLWQQYKIWKSYLNNN